MKVLVTGAGGMLGSRLAADARDRGHEVVALSRRELDVTRAEDVRRRVAAEAPDWLAHCAAFTAVDRAEEERERAEAVNAESVKTTARAAADVGARFLFPSTDFVFGGEARVPYAPTAQADPRSQYGRSKWQGEVHCRASGAGYLIARTSWLYGSGGPNFVDMVIQRSQAGRALRIVSDQVGRPTWTGSLSQALLDLMEANQTGVTHVADRGTASWYDLAQAAVETAGVEAELSAVSTREWGALAARPAYSVLSLDDVEGRLGRAMPEWRESLERHVSERWPSGWTRAVPPTAEGKEQ